MQSLPDLQLSTLDGHPASLSQFGGKVLLIVNVASRCGYTPQYAALEALFRKYEARGFSILGFPCDQFGHQEPGTESEIIEFCSTHYDVTFPLFSKLDVNGPNAHPLYRFLRAQLPSRLDPNAPGARSLHEYLEKNHPELLDETAVHWNFTKFLIDRQGHVVRRFESPVTPEQLEPSVLELLDAR
jgi:glutathione peroxidase